MLQAAAVDRARPRRRRVTHGRLHRPDAQPSRSRPERASCLLFSKGSATKFAGSSIRRARGRTDSATLQRCVRPADLGVRSGLRPWRYQAPAVPPDEHRGRDGRLLRGAIPHVSDPTAGKIQGWTVSAPRRREEAASSACRGRGSLGSPRACPGRWLPPPRRGVSIRGHWPGIPSPLARANSEHPWFSCASRTTCRVAMPRAARTRAARLPVPNDDHGRRAMNAASALRLAGAPPHLDVPRFPRLPPARRQQCADREARAKQQEHEA
ncbi:hypothetical protein PAHAL_9G136400 [Panicum hallii]|jgi:hypothetical protein|uniref:Uncharacterized protein n=1 Tax=Panicum hallii TaxID=206008 RepID=A0A2S3IJC3_9POAL|nr:hypothetical protein PAHAL_9G136400 [Panicum hallii]